MDTEHKQIALLNAAMEAVVIPSVMPYYNYNYVDITNSSTTYNLVDDDTRNDNPTNESKTQQLWQSLETKHITTITF